MYSEVTVNLSPITIVADHLLLAYFECVLVRSFLPLSFFLFLYHSSFHSFLLSGGYACRVIVPGPLKEDLNDMLVQEFPNKFAGCRIANTYLIFESKWTFPADTPCEPCEGEVERRDYHFVSSVEQMERGIQAHLFIKDGMYKDNLCGTNIKAVQKVAIQVRGCLSICLSDTPFLR